MFLAGRTMRRHAHMAAFAAALAIGVGCAPTFVETTSASLKGVLDASGAACALAVDVAKRAQDRVADELDAASAAIPSEAPDRAVQIQALKVKAKQDILQIRRDRDRVLDACAKAYRAIGMGQALLPLADDPARRAQIEILVQEAFAALEATSAGPR